MENCGLQEKLDALTERLDRESIVTVACQDRCDHDDALDRDDGDGGDDAEGGDKEEPRETQFCCRSLGAGSEDVDGLTLTSIRSTTSSASKVKPQKVKVESKRN